MNATAIITGIVCAGVGFWAGIWFCRDLDREKARDLRIAHDQIRRLEDEAISQERRIDRLREMVEEAKQTGEAILTGLYEIDPRRRR